MRIGVSTLMIQRGRTGVAQYVLALARQFSEFPAHQFTLFALEEDKKLFSPTPNVTLLTVPEKYRSPIRNILWHQSHLPRLARQLQLDVLHVPSYRRMVWSSPCASVATIHDLAPFRVAKKYDPARMFYGRVVAKRLAHRQDRIISVSHQTSSDIQHFFGVPSEKIEVIHNGIEHERFLPGSSEAAKKTLDTNQEIRWPFFLYISRLEHPAKNHVRLITAFEEFKKRTGSPWHLVLGGADWHGAEVIHQRIVESPVRKEIHCPGFISDADLPTWYRAADVFVYPSLFEGFGLPPIEAMASGCPVISSARGALAEVLGKAAIIIDPENCPQMADALGRLAREEATRRGLIASGLRHASKFNWRTTAAATISVYTRAASGSGSDSGSINTVSTPPGTSNGVSPPKPVGNGLLVSGLAVIIGRGAGPRLQTIRSELTS